MSAAVTAYPIKEPYAIGKMGTSGLRQVQEVYNQPLFLEQFAQGVAEYFKELTAQQEVAVNNKTLLLGGDPRKGNRDRIKRIAAILVGNGFSVKLAKNGLASTPAMSHGIRKLQVAGGIVLTASHNPFTDVGIKINMADGSPALTDTVNRIHQLQNAPQQYYTVEYDQAVKDGMIEEIDIIKMYADLLDEILDFKKMQEKLQQHSLKAAFDAMHGAAGPFAREVFINRLGMDAKILREEPREDLGGFDASGEPLHPEPDFDYISELIELNSSGEYDLVGAWDSDVDRRLDGGKGFWLESADEFALFSKYSELINISELFEKQLFFGRSTVTAPTIDLMEQYLQKKFSDKKVQAVQTPTGFKWIADLGNWGVEESNGVGNPYLREKDGIFATAFLLKILLETGKTPQQLMEEIWSEFGRVYFTRGEVSGSDETQKPVLEEILQQAPQQTGKQFGPLKLESAESWNYVHPVSGEIAEKDAAYVLNFSDGNTVKARFSGTGSGGYTMRVYCTKYDKQYNIAKSGITRPMKDAFDAFLQANGFADKSKKYTDANQPEPYSS